MRLEGKVALVDQRADRAIDRREPRLAHGLKGRAPLGLGRAVSGRG
jgi:hypothetical protein